MSDQELLTPLTVDSEMRKWLRAMVGRTSDPERRLTKLTDALLHDRGFRELTFPQSTPTAIEAFRSHSANCVGFALLFVALAREADVPAFFVVIPERRDGRRRGRLRLVEDHLAAGAVVDGKLILYDLGGRRKPSPGFGQPVSDLTALAIYHSNRGAELLATGHPADASKQLELALRLDPELSAIWVNLGVARRRLGDLSGAEGAYRRALELDPRDAGAHENLVGLLGLYGRRDEASTLESPDPLDALERAAARLERGELEAARDLYRRALTLSQ